MRFLQNRNLPGVIEFVLNNPVQQVIEIVSLAGDALSETRVVQRSNRCYERVMRASGHDHGPAPRGIVRRGRKRKIRRPGGLTFFSAEAAESRAIPSRDVQDKLPNTVGLGKRLGGGRGCVYVLQQFDHGGPVPCAAVEGATQLVGDAAGFGLGSYRFRFHRINPEFPPLQL
jgi:hypothetical protein